MEEKLEKEYIHWYRIAQTYANDESLIPNRNDAEILRNLSRENWLMFVKATPDDKHEAVNYPEPNIYLNIDDDSMTLGITFNNAGSVDKFTNIIKGSSSVEREKLVQALLKLNDNYNTVVNRKMREMYGPAPTYKRELVIQTNRLNETEFKKIIELIIKIREEGQENRKTAKFRSYFEGPGIDLIEIDITKDEDLFKRTILEFLNIYRICLEVKTNEQIGDIDLLEKIKQIDSWDWYLDQDRTGLAEKLKERFQIEISPAALKKLQGRIE